MKMMKRLAFGLMAAAALALTGCGYATVPPAMKGKVLTTSGYSADVKETGKYLLWGRDEMVLLDTSTQTYGEPVEVKMTDNLNLKFDVRFRTRIAGGQDVINAMFNDIVAQNNAVTLPMVYKVYGRDVVQSVARSVVGKYGTEEVAANFDKITADLATQLKEKLKNSPLEMSNITLGNLDYPTTIDEAYAAQGAKRLAIETEANNQAVEMVKKTNALKLAEANYAIEVKKAETLRDTNALTAAGLSPALLAYRALEVQEKMAENKSAVFVPYDALNTTGVNNRIFNK
jgi:regulator of protease activity HflC (stomatin/prohibitin superfamily)